MFAAIVGIASHTLSPDEAALFRARPPAGVILFGRNVGDPDQLRVLCAALREVLPPGAVIAVDQEGGRVARLRPPGWRAHPPAAAIGGLHQRDPAAGERAAYLTGALIGLDCAASGLDMACAPVLDLRIDSASDVIGDRSYGSDPRDVAALAKCMAAGLMAAGVLPVGKHAPGHGRAQVDSHHALPVIPAGVSLDDDIEAFTLCSALPWMMTAHLLYERIDAERPGTLSPAVIGGVIRERIGFAGVLVSDDLAMKALDGEPWALAAAALAAGCDIALHCSGVLDESRSVLSAVPSIGAACAARMTAARAAVAGRRTSLEAEALAVERGLLLA
ncbi:MAG: beta-N-acetylhexosaminidase [Acetobacteraceae bacterium]|nr:beta-N-acetylhexosaminidase [Acetobacteraceae bacterium]